MIQKLAIALHWFTYIISLLVMLTAQRGKELICTYHEYEIFILISERKFIDREINRRHTTLFILLKRDDILQIQARATEHM